MADDEDDKTHIGVKLPPKLPVGPKPAPTTPPAASPPPASAPVSDSTKPAVDRPPVLKPQPPKPLVEPPSHETRAPSPVDTGGKQSSHEPQATSHQESADDDEATVFDVRPRSSIRLQRVQPPGHSEIMTLDRGSYLLGRLNCDIKLYTQSASREHARLTNLAGTWHIEAIQDRIVLVNGAPIHGPTALSHKMVVKLGGDELIFLDERAALAATAPTPAAEPARHIGLIVLIVTLIGLVLAAGAWWWSTQP